MTPTPAKKSWLPVYVLLEVQQVRDILKAVQDAYDTLQSVERPFGLVPRLEDAEKALLTALGDSEQPAKEQAP